ncbi:hypothetical protein [Dyadobacter crusticola]|uniref:hypothetical protein n=1 Tax=Dyadobacter crusticola TaxID=292407 RepID=UPI0004E16BDD|nr:hypothetical protein [Dyadobacter crusticola]
MKRSFYLLLLITTLFGCAKKDHEEPEPKPAVDKNAFLATLRAGHKYWRCEELTIEQGGVAKTFNMLSNEAKMDGSTFLAVVAASAYSFGPETATVHVIDYGPYGNVPYATNFKFREFLPQSASTGTCSWNDERETLEVRLPDSYFGRAVQSLSKNQYLPSVGYLDNTFPAKYKTEEEAIAGASPDRIRMIYYEEDPQAGQVRYIFTMRAAWVTKVDRIGPREHWYEVLY